MLYDKKKVAWILQLLRVLELTSWGKETFFLDCLFAYTIHISSQEVVDDLW